MKVFIYSAVMSLSMVYSSQAGYLYVTTNAPDQIVTYNTNVSSPSPTLFSATGVDNARGSAFDSLGNLYVANQANFTIEKYASNGNSTQFADIEYGGLNGLAIDSSNNVFVSEAGPDFNGIFKITPNGTVSLFASKGLDAPTGLAFDASGNLFVANAYSNEIDKIAPDGTLSVFANVAQGLNDPRGLAFDSFGNLYVANDTDAGGTSFIEKITASGVSSVFASGLTSPLNIVFDSGNNLYIDQSVFNGSIIKVTPDGTSSVFASSIGTPVALAYENLSAIPEPSSLFMMAIGVIIIGVVLAKDRNQIIARQDAE